MAAKHEHLKWAEDNESFASSLNLKDNLEVNWAITALFYAAVHYVDAYLVARGRRQPDHAGRECEIKNDDFFEPIRRNYKRLKDMSREARYELAPYVESDFRKAELHLERIKAHIYARV